ncbi:MAG: T9SS type A sorting domain-containing protein [Chitinophagales bacterium]
MRKNLYFINFLVTILFISKIYSQTPVKITSTTTHYVVTSDNSSYIADGCVAASGSYEMKFGTSSGLWSNHIQILDAANTSTGECFQQIPSTAGQIIKLRRVDNAFITGESSCIWVEGTTPLTTGGTSSTRLPYEDVMETVFSSGWFNAGTDNLFDNTAAGTNNNNIERFDVILTAGFTISNAVTEGIILFERGADGAHDKVKIVGISSLDVTNDPNGFKTAPLTINTADWGNITGGSVTYTVLRKDVGDAKLRPSNKSNSQNRGGVFVSFSTLGFITGETIYGYSLMATDVTASTAAQVLDYTNASIFPTNTVDATGGGIDLIGVTYFYELVDICGPLLPLELFSFTAEPNGAGNVLNWATLSENNIDQFEIEYSPDGQNFKKIGSLNAKGTNSEESFYTYRHFPVSTVLSYYRIKQVDTDGEIWFSEVISVSNEMVQETIFTVFPNPATENDHIYITGADPSTYKLKIYSIFGSQMLNGEYYNGEESTQLQVKGLGKGQYIFEMINLETGVINSQKVFVHGRGE